jgi:hypothetical protein
MLTTELLAFVTENWLKLGLSALFVSLSSANSTQYAQHAGQGFECQGLLVVKQNGRRLHN